VRLQGQPVVSIGNIAQLAVDLLIASLSLRKIGIFDPRDLVPVIGGREDGEEGITTPLECVCFHSSCGLMLLQLVNIDSIRTGRVRNCTCSTTVTRIGGA